MKKTKCLFIIIAIAIFSTIGCSDTKDEISVSEAGSNSVTKLENQDLTRNGKFQNGFDLIDVKYNFQKIGNFENIKLSKDENIYIYDGNKKDILYAKTYIDEKGYCYLPYELCVWNVVKQKVTQRIKINDKNSKISVIAAVMYNNDIVFSTIDWSIHDEDKTIWKVNLFHNGKITTIDKGICRVNYVPVIRKMGDSLVYAFENFDLDNNYIFGVKLLNNGKLKTLISKKGNISKDNPYALLTCTGASNSTNYVYFIEKGKDAFFYIVDKKGNLKVIPLKGKIYTYALFKDTLFQSVVENENQNNQLYKIYIDSFTGENKFNVTTFGEFYRPVSNGKNMALMVTYADKIYLIGVNNGKVFRSDVSFPEDFPEHEGKSVKFFNIDKNSFYIFYTLKHELYKITFENI